MLELYPPRPWVTDFLLPGWTDYTTEDIHRNRSTMRTFLRASGPRSCLLLNLGRRWDCERPRIRKWLVLFPTSSFYRNIDPSFVRKRHRNTIETPHEASDISRRSVQAACSVFAPLTFFPYSLYSSILCREPIRPVAVLKTHAELFLILSRSCTYFPIEPDYMGHHLCYHDSLE